MKTKFTRIIAIVTFGLIAICTSASSASGPECLPKANSLCPMTCAGRMPHVARW